jgi:hypothetical protein
MTGLKDLLNAAIGRGTETTKRKADEPMETVSTTVRFGGDLRLFLEAQAEAWGGVSTQAVITTILNGTMHETLEHNRNQVDVVPRRILDIFDRHQIDMLTAAEILGVPFADMTPERLLLHIDNPMVDRLSKTFNVRREWMLGQWETPGSYPITWYKELQTAVRHILDRVMDEEILSVRVVFLTGESWDLFKMLNTEGRDNVVTLIELTRQTPSGHQYTTYDRLQELHWNDEVTRSYILTLAMFCDAVTSGRYGWHSAAGGEGLDDLLPYEKKILWQGLMVPDRELKRFISTGSLLPTELMRTRGPIGSASSLGMFVLGPTDSSLSTEEFNEVKTRCEALIASLVSDAKRKQKFNKRIEDIDGKFSELEKDDEQDD